MKIIEVRDGFIVFEAGKDICLSSFVKIGGVEKSYIAQITQLKLFGEISIASAKILFLYNDNKLTNYDGSLPDKNSQIESFTQDIISNSIKSKRPVIIGKTMDNSSNITIDYSAFNKKMLMSIDSSDLNNLLVRNLTKQFEHLGMKTIILDTLGVIKSKKYTAGVDFKLPLDTDSLSFMYDSCLSDATSDSKSTIVEIFQELSEYSKTVPFVPFETLKSIVDTMVDKQHVFKLLVLKSKLAKFEKLGYFATKEQEVESLNNILSGKCVVIDLSRLDMLFLNRYLSYIYEKIQKLENVQIIFEASNTVSKKSLKNILTDSNVPISFVTHSKFQYLNDMKNMFDNFIIEPSLTNKKVFDIYSSFLNPVKQGLYLSAGEALNYIPLLSNAQIIDEVAEYTEEPEPIQKEVETIAEEIESEQEVIETIEEENIAEEPVEEELNDISEEIIQTQEPEGEIKEELTEEALDFNEEEIEEQEIDAEILEEPEEMEEEEVVNEVPSMSQDEIYSAIEEKSENILSSVAENFDADERLNLFDEEGEIIEDVPSQKEQNNENEEDYASQSEENSVTIEEKDLDDSEEDSNSEIEEEEIIEPEDTSESDSIVNDIDEVSDTQYSEDIEYNQTGEMQVLNSDEDLAISQEDFDNESSVLKEIEAGYEEDDEEGENQQNESEASNEEIEVDEDVDSMINNVEEEELEVLDSDTLGSHLDIDLSAEPKILPLSGEEYTQDFDEIVELDPNEAGDDDILVDMTEDDNNVLVDENTEQEIIEAVDRVYTTPPKDEEEISDSDLDLIDELNNENDEGLEPLSDENIEDLSGDEDDEGLLEEFHNENENISTFDDSADDAILEHRSSSTPIVPVYDAEIPEEDMVISDPIQQGDAVRHAKYGNGVVEKMIKYGSKTLFAINFENLGRRLLDPTLTEIKKI